MTKLRLAILISGRGSNMDSILTAATQADYPAKPVLVLANNPEAGGLAAATKRGLDAVALDHRPFKKDREAFERALHAVLTDHEVDIIALAGFMRILTPWFVNRWEGRMVNIHPSLLPKYPGLNTHQRAIDAGEREAGCSVHWVTEGVDEGAVIDQARVAVEPGDTAETLAARVLVQEHRLYPNALAKACDIILEQCTQR